MRKRTKVILVISVAAVGLAAAVVLYKRQGAKEYLQTQLAEADAFLREAAAAEFTRPAFAPWPDDAPTAERETDARALYERAATLAKAIQDRALDWEQDDDEAGWSIDPFVTYWDDIDEEETPEDAARIRREARTILVKFPEPLRLLARALSVDRVRANPELVHGVDGGGEKIEAIQDLGGLLQLAYVIYREDGAHEDILRWVTVQILMAHDLARGDGLIREFLRKGHIAVAVDEARRTLERAAVGEPTLVRLRRVIRYVRTSAHAPADVWRVEGALLRRTTARTFLTGGDPDDKPGPAHLWLSELLGASWLRSLEEPLDRLIAMADEPLAEARRQAETLAAQTKERHPFAGMVVAVAPFVFEARMRAEQHLLLLDAATAIALHRKRTGHWPASLAVLGLDHAICPVSEHPLRYEPGKVWSIGGDGKDDGGRPRHEDADWDADGDDVWDLTQAR